MGPPLLLYMVLCLYRRKSLMACHIDKDPMGGDRTSLDRSDDSRAWKLVNSLELLPVGCGFRPTDGELVMHYLKGKINCSSSPIEHHLVPELDVYTFDPLDLPGKSKFQSGDAVWHFISPKDRKYSGSRRYSRPTRNGRWLYNGKERDIKLSNGSRVIGKKRTLLFYEHRSQEAEIRNLWAIHEYHTTDYQDDSVLCRLLKKPVEMLPQKQNQSHNNMTSSSSGCAKIGGEAEPRDSRTSLSAAEPEEQSSICVR